MSSDQDTSNPILLAASKQKQWFSKSVEMPPSNNQIIFEPNTRFICPLCRRKDLSTLRHFGSAENVCDYDLLLRTNMGFAHQYHEDQYDWQEKAKANGGVNLDPPPVLKQVSTAAWLLMKDRGLGTYLGVYRNQPTDYFPRDVLVGPVQIDHLGNPKPYPSVELFFDSLPEAYKDPSPSIHVESHEDYAKEMLSDKFKYSSLRIKKRKLDEEQIKITEAENAVKHELGLKLTSMHAAVGDFVKSLASNEDELTPPQQEALQTLKSKMLALDYPLHTTN